MRMRRTSALAISLALVFSLFCLFPVGSIALAAGPEEKKPAGTEGQMPPMSAEEQEMMAKWQLYSTPAENHKLLEDMIGTWDLTTRMWMAPDAPVQESTGVSVNTWVLGGRFVKQEVQGMAMGMPFEGIGYTGYDIYKGKYVGIWMDNMGTMIMTSIGTYDPMNKTFIFTSRMDDVFKGKEVEVREVVRVIDRDNSVFEMFCPGPDGKEFKTMELIYKRKK